jgi:hypothetical protein
MELLPELTTKIFTRWKVGSEIENSCDGELAQQSHQHDK